MIFEFVIENEFVKCIYNNKISLLKQSATAFVAGDSYFPEKFLQNYW